jgi:hypothetical protein
MQVVPRHFYVRLSIPRAEMTETAHSLRRTIERLVDCGIGTVQDRHEYWVECRHLCANAGQFLAILRMLGIPAGDIRECREIAPNTGHLMAKQPSLF